LNKGIGTTFAYLVRAALVITIGSTYWQIFWDTLHRKTLTVSTIDSLAGVLGALQEFFNLTIFKASPLLVALAVLSWLMPLVAIVPPVTPTISPSILTNQYSTTLQTPDFAHRAAFAIVNDKYLGYNDPLSAPSYSVASSYSGPNRDLLRLMMGSVYEGALPVFSSQAENSSYSQNWLGPAVQCQSIPTSIVSNFTPAMGGFDPSLPASAYESGFHYLAWVPGNVTIPFGNNSIRTYNETWEGVGALPTKATLSAIDGGPAEIFVAARANISTSDWTVLNCSLHNASYTVDFAFADRSQDVKVSVLHILNLIAPTTSPDDLTFSNGNWTVSASPESVSYQALMDVLGTVLAGAIWFAPGADHVPGGGPNSGNSSSVARLDALEIDRTCVRA
jgi:hypothetical protein